MDASTGLDADKASPERVADRAERAEAALRGKSEAVAVICHELRTPMGAMISLADLLLATPLDETQRRYALTLQQSARSLLCLLDDVLDNEQLEAGKFPFEPRAVDLDEFLTGVETSLLARAQTAGLAGNLMRAGPLPARIRLDPLRLRQVLDNLIDNAAKYTRKGSIAVTVRYDARGDGPTGSGDLSIAVSDTGIGLAEEDRKRLFQPFMRAEEARSGTYRGAGLGLSIVARLVALMNGAISCDSAPGKGSTFTVTLPCPIVEKDAAADRGGASAPMSAIAPARPAGPARPGRARGPLRALVVEDNQINQTLIGAFLETFGMEGHMTGSGDEALTLLAEQPFDVVLMDLRMMGMDGIETTQRIRALEGPASLVPIVAITAQAHAADRERVLAAGMNGYVSKPIDPRALYAEIVAAVGEPAQTRSRAT